MKHKGDTSDWLIRYIPIMILVLATLLVVFRVATFDVKGAGTDIALQGNVRQVDQWCEREVGEQTMEFELPEVVESVEIDSGIRFRATLDDGTMVTVEAQSCEQVEICAEGSRGRTCETGGTLPGGTFEVELYFDGAEVIIDPQN